MKQYLVFILLLSSLHEAISIEDISFCFTVDASGAGAGEVALSVKCDNKKLPTKVVSKGAGFYKGYFMPKDPRKHIVFVTFTKEAAPGGLKFSIPYSF